MRSAAADLWRSARPSQWQKNLLVFAPLLFTAGVAWHPADPEGALWPFLRMVAVFLLLCLAASGSYLLNDAADADADRLHPVKRRRPVAAGRLPVRQARIAASVLLALPLLLAPLLGTGVWLAVAGYEVLAVGYTMTLRGVPFLDVAAVAGGFALRVVAGAEAIGVPESGWIVACTALGAAYVVLMKRAQETRLLGSDAARHRPSLRRYGTRGADRLAIAMGVTTVAVYAAYTLTASNLPESGAMAITVPFVAFGIARYRLVALRSPERNADELLVRDRPLLATVALFAVTAVAVLLTA